MKKSPFTTGQKFPFINRFLTGLVIALTLSLTAFEWTTITTEETLVWKDGKPTDIEELLPPITYRVEKPEFIPPPKEQLSDIIKIVDEIPIEKEKPIIIDEPTPELKPMVFTVNKKDYGMDEEEFVDDIAYEKVQVFAHYNDCKGLTNDALMECGMVSITNMVKEKFKVSAQLRDIGGRQGALMEVIIDKNGVISSITTLQKTSIPMEKATRKAIQSLPKMNPAQQQGKNVSLKIKVPVVLKLQD